MVSHRKPAKPAFDPRTVKENIVETPLNEEMSKSFLEYAYSVIYARALPDARDGLKPVQRRIIYQMGQMNLNPDRPYMKSAVWSARLWASCTRMATPPSMRRWFVLRSRLRCDCRWWMAMVTSVPLTTVLRPPVTLRRVWPRQRLA